MCRLDLYRRCRVPHQCNDEQEMSICRPVEGSIQICFAFWGHRLHQPKTQQLVQEEMTGGRHVTREQTELPPKAGIELHSVASIVAAIVECFEIFPDFEMLVILTNRILRYCPSYVSIVHVGVLSLQMHLYASILTDRIDM